ncbi:MAG: DUF5113 domain-containing protein [Paraprevotella sp.]|nr:DUF5113 domain-containing protein [Paraprevotella sp.]
MKELVDSLNGEAYAWRYKDVARSLAFACRAHGLSEDYGDGHCEALNHIVYACYHQMDFDRAERLARQVRRQAGSQIEALVADVMLMKICQRTSRNRLFYVYRNSAERRILRIEEERNLLTGRERMRLLFAETEFHIVSSTYYYYLKQLPRALAEIEVVGAMNDLRRDTAQWLYYNYMKGSGGLCEGRNAEEVALREFDYLFKSFTLSKVAGYLYFEGNNLQSLASLLARKDFFALVHRNRPDGLRYLWNLYHEGMVLMAEDSLCLSGWLARGALEKFRLYGDLYQVACAYRTTGELQLEEGRYEEALHSFIRALGYVNHHHRRFYPADSLRELSPYAEADGVSVEMQWMNDGDVRTVPEWIAGIRERMSVAYSALGDKRKSDYNRNVYLDILEQTRQDRELENRYEELNAGSRALSLLLVLVLGGMLLLVAVCVYLYRLGRRRSRRQVALLQHVLESCRRLTSADAGMPAAELPWTREEQQTIARLLQPYDEWAKENCSVLQELDDRRQSVHEQRAVSELRIAGNKRKNVENRARLSLMYAIVPFIDRMLGEVARLRRNDGKRQERLVYVKELADRIRLYNDILTDWIQLRQGELSLHVETFAMQDVFDVVKKSYRGFEQAGLTLDVLPTDTVVKADKALTLFMVNTLADNARKFTPPGGRVTLEASGTDAYVEVRVADTGCGLTPEEVDRILTSKVYDASDIGTCNEFAQSHKGHGFGLMNCKGIIEKYRKTSDLFRVCTFFVTSRAGQGSCFGFRLPRGVRKSLFAGLLLWSSGVCDARAAEAAVPESGQRYAALLQQARMYNDSLYFANLEGAYEHALAYSDSTLHYLNVYYSLANPGKYDFLDREAGDGAEVPSEVKWWTDGWTEMDYGLLLGWRNETAVAALAMHEWGLYQYNNDVYTQLYKWVSQDRTLGADCKAMEASQNNKRVGIILLVCLAAVGILVFYIFYFRRVLLFRMNLAQLLATNRRLLECFRKGGDMNHRVTELLQTVWEGLNEIHAVDGLQLELCDENGVASGCFTVGDAAFHASADSRVRSYPLRVEGALGRDVRFGTLQIHVPDDGAAGEPEYLLDEMMVNYLSALLYGGLVRRRQEREELEQAEDERQRALYEENQLHVQNQILDNCLSTIKHEAMYYPGRISQMADRLARADDEKDDIPAMVEELNEWVLYYRTLYTLLGRQAEHQLARVNFRRRPCQIDGLLDGALRRMSVLMRESGEGLLVAENVSGTSAVTGDADLLACLLEVLLSATVEDCRRASTEPALTLRAEDEGRFVRFTLMCETVGHTEAELHELFMPDASHIPYLISKQIIREHDMFTNHCGCRINAEALPDGGYCIWFTLPKSKEHETF